MGYKGKRIGYGKKKVGYKERWQDVGKWDSIEYEKKRAWERKGVGYGEKRATWGKRIWGEREYDIKGRRVGCGRKENRI